MAKLETCDIVDSWEDHSPEKGTMMVEHTIGTCPNCNHTFDYHQYFSHNPIGFDYVEDITEEEEE